MRPSPGRPDCLVLFPENLERALPGGLRATVERSSWTPPAEFRFVMQRGRIEREEMDRTFNMGIGMIAVVAAEDESDVRLRLIDAGETVWTIGSVDAGERGVVMR